MPSSSVIRILQPADGDLGNVRVLTDKFRRGTSPEVGVTTCGVSSTMAKEYSTVRVTVVPRSTRWYAGITRDPVQSPRVQSLHTQRPELLGTRIDPDMASASGGTRFRSPECLVAVVGVESQKDPGATKARRKDLARQMHGQHAVARWCALERWCSPGGNGLGTTKFSQPGIGAERVAISVQCNRRLTERALLHRPHELVHRDVEQAVVELARSA